jgi:hypothetical protein
MMLCDTDTVFSSGNPSEYGVVQVATESQTNVSKFLEHVRFRIQIPVKARISVGSLLGKCPCEGLHPQSKSSKLV